MSIHGCFLCFGPSAEPKLVVLSESRMQLMADKMRVAETRCRDTDTARGQVYAEFCGKGVQWAIPAWSKPAMLSLIKEYEGPHKDAIRSMAAMLHQGFYEKVYNGVVLVRPNPPDRKGGQPAKIDPVKPKPRKPNGGAKVDAKPVPAGARR